MYFFLQFNHKKYKKTWIFVMLKYMIVLQSVSIENI